MTEAVRKSASGEQQAPKRQRRPWPMVVIGLLLLLEGAGYVTLIVLRLSVTERIVIAQLTATELIDIVLGQLLYITLLAVIVGVALFAIFSIVRRWANAWSNAMFVQMLSLALGIGLYYTSRPFYTYIILLVSVFVVVYLMLPGVQAAFLPPGGEQ